MDGISTWPVEASTPDGRSTATIGLPDPAASSIAAAIVPRGAPLLPVPRSASTRKTEPVTASRAPGAGIRQERDRKPGALASVVGRAGIASERVLFGRHQHPHRESRCLE